MKKLIRLVLSIVPASLLWGNAIAQPSTPPRVSVPATGLSLQQPDGFEAATSFNGFQQESTGSSVVVTVIPGPYTEITKGLTAEALAARGIELISQESHTIADQPGTLLHLSQDAFGQTFQKWLVVFGDATETRMVTATFPEEESESLSESLRMVVLSSTRSESSDQTSSLPFEIGQVEGLVPVEQLNRVGKIAAFSNTGDFPPASSAPLFIVAPSLGDVPVIDPESYARERLQLHEKTEVIRLEQISEIRIDGLDGFEIEAMGRDKGSDQPILLYQVMLFPAAGGYVLMYGESPQEERDHYFPKFQELARTYRTLEK